MLEDRLQGMVEGSLAEALSAANTSGPGSKDRDEATQAAQEEGVRKLCKLLLAVDRYATVEALYCTTRMAQVGGARGWVGAHLCAC